MSGGDKSARMRDTFPSEVQMASIRSYALRSVGLVSVVLLALWLLPAVWAPVVRAPVNERIHEARLRSAPMVDQMLRCAELNTNAVVTLGTAHALGYLSSADLEVLQSNNAEVKPFTVNSPPDLVILTLPVIYKGELRATLIYRRDGSGMCSRPNSHSEAFAK